MSTNVRGAGTHVGNMAFDPAAQRLFVANLEDINQVRFEPNLRGRGIDLHGHPRGRGGRLFALDRDSNGVLNDDEPRTSVSLTGRVVDAGGAGLAGVVVGLTGTQSASAVTDASGRYTFNFLSTSGTHTVTPQRAGLQFTPASRTFANPSWNQSANFITSSMVKAFITSIEYRGRFGQ